MSAGSKNKLNIFEYTNYRVFLKDAFEHLKLTRRGFSYRNFIKDAGLASAGFITLIIGDKRNLTPETVGKFSKGLRLNKQESEYFENLVFFNQAKNSDEKNRYFDKISKHRKYKEIHILDSDKFEFFSKWYYAATRELIHLKQFVDSPEWIAKTLNPSISEKQAKEAIDLLLKLGLIERSPEGKLKTREVNISSGAEVQSLAVKNYHHEMLNTAKHALDTLPGTERDISAVILTSSKKKISEIKEEIKEFRKRLLQIASEKVEDHDQVFQLNMQFFPLTKKQEDL